MLNGSNSNIHDQVHLLDMQLTLRYEMTFFSMDLDVAAVKDTHESQIGKKGFFNLKSKTGNHEKVNLPSSDDNKRHTNAELKLENY